MNRRQAALPGQLHTQVDTAVIQWAEEHKEARA